MNKVLVVSEIRNQELPKEIKLAISKLDKNSIFDFCIIGNFDAKVNLPTHSFNRLMVLDANLNFNLTIDNDFSDYQYIISHQTLKINQLIAQIGTNNSLPTYSQIIDFEYDGSRISQFTQSVFSGKATQKFSPTSDRFILNCSKLFIGDLDITDLVGKDLENFDQIPINSLSKEKILNTQFISGGINIEEAAIVIGAGRGMKGPENWNIIEELAEKLGAGTACSKPVSDLDWRPHHEHVGQTGVKIAPDLYIACGISGAVQHLAGVNGSKTIVVINNDPEAPFAKNADYILQGDLFKIVPRLINKLS